MWKQKIGISVPDNISVETIELLSKIGFDAISPEAGAHTEKIVRIARNLNLTIQSLHSPYDKTDNMWSDNAELADAKKNQLLDSLDVCRRFCIPVMVVHAWIGFEYTAKPNEYGLKNFSSLVERASEYGVKIAFENTEGEEFLYALMDYFKGNDTVGFCWDSGHEMCYNHSKDLLKDFGDRLIMTHINDNLGISRFDGKIFWTDDLHLLPYDGIADWDYNIKRLKNSKRLEILNFELKTASKPDRHENDIYTNMTPGQYYTEAYKRACKIAYRYSL